MNVPPTQAAPESTPELGHGFTFAELASRDGLRRLDRGFLGHLAAEDPSLHVRLLTARAAPDALAAKDESDLIVALGEQLENFVASLFGITAELAALAARTHALDPIHACKRLFVQRQAVKKFSDPSGFDGLALRAALEARIGAPLTESSFASAVGAWEEKTDTAALDTALHYAAWATLTAAGRAAHAGGTLFRVPQRVAPENLVAVETIERDGVTMLRLPEHDWRPRDGFCLTDAGMNDQQVLDQVNYCIWCHTQGKDSCRTGLRDRKTEKFQNPRAG